MIDGDLRLGWNGQGDPTGLSPTCVGISCSDMAASMVFLKQLVPGLRSEMLLVCYVSLVSAMVIGQTQAIHIFSVARESYVRQLR